ncbi:MAG: FAD binding domain-containing protein [Candidatus Sumerlaeaceae bacterium]
MSTLPIFEMAMASDAKQAIAQLGNDWNSAAVYAGGMDLLDLMKERVYEPRLLVNIKPDASLKYIQIEGDGRLRIGPLTTLTEIAEHPDILKSYPALALACGKAATPQVRNVATLGGNLCQRPRCWYFRNEEFPCLRKGGDTCFAKEGENKYHAIFTENEPCVIVHPSAAAVALVALNGRVKIIGTSERELSLDEFFVLPKQNVQRENVLKPNELITEIIIPGASRSWKSTYMKLRERQSYDWPLADVAIAAEMDGLTVKSCRVVLGAAAPVPYRARDAEEFLRGKAITTESATQAGELAVKGAMPLSQNAYKLQLFKVITRRTLLNLAEVKVS